VVCTEGDRPHETGTEVHTYSKKFDNHTPQKIENKIESEDKDKKQMCPGKKLFRYHSGVRTPNLWVLSLLHASKKTVGCLFSRID